VPAREPLRLRQRLLRFEREFLRLHSSANLTQRRQDAKTRNFNTGLGTAKHFGLRWQSAAATPLFDGGQNFQSGVALRFPPHSKKKACVSAPLRLCIKESFN
jgi:hypothetical protein